MKIVLSFITLFLIVSSTNAQWVQMSNGMGTNKNVRSLATSGDTIFAGTKYPYGGVYRSTNNGLNWTQTSLNNQSGNVLLINGNNIYAGTNQGVFKSTNSGQNWVQIGISNRRVLALTIHGNNIFAGTDYGRGVYRSTNNGLNWTQTSLSNQFIRSLVTRENNIFAGDYGSNSVFLSSDTGNTWTQIALGGAPYIENVFCLAVKGNYMFAGVNNGGVYRSSNGGFNWTQTSLNNGGITSFTIKDNYIFASDHLCGVVYLSSNNGMSWILKNQGLESINDVWSLTTTSQYIFAGTDSSVWRRSFTEIIGIKKISELVPSSFSLSQNYPNPFNPTTKISFDLHKSSHAKLIVYDILGKEVATLVNEKLNAGSYKVDWNASDYPSGVYFYRVQTEDFSETKKMVLLK